MGQFKNIKAVSFSVDGDCPAALYLDFGDVPWCLYSMKGGGLDPMWFDPQRLISVGFLSVDLLKHLPRQVVNSLGNRKSSEILKMSLMLQWIGLSG